MEIFLLILGIAIVVILVVTLLVSYYFFRFIFDRNFIVPQYDDPKKYDNASDLFRPTHKLLMDYTKPFRDKFNEYKFEDLEIKSFDGLKLHGYLLRGSTNEVVICVHGFKSLPFYDYAEKIPMYKERGTNILLVDDRAHGKSEGKYLGFSELDKYDVASWVEKINEMFDNPSIFLHGISMGGATVIHTADMNLKNVKGIIDDCGYDTIDNIIRFQALSMYHLPYFPICNFANMWAKKIAKVDFKKTIGSECVKKASCPILFIHGNEDHFVPSFMSDNLYDACNSPKEYYQVENCGHAGAYSKDPAKYKEYVFKLMDGKIK